MAGRQFGVRSGEIDLIDHTTEPSDPVNGQSYYDLRLNKARIYENGEWHDYINSDAYSTDMGPLSAEIEATATKAELLAVCNTVEQLTQEINELPRFTASQQEVFNEVEEMAASLTLIGLQVTALTAQVTNLIGRVSALE